MGHTAQKADSLDRVEILMAIEEEFPELGSAFETLWELDPDFDEKAVVPLRPYIVAPVQAEAIRGGVVTHVTVFARFGDRVMGLDHDCKQVAIGTMSANRELSDVQHYRTLEMASRAFLSEAGHVVVADPGGN